MTAKEFGEMLIALPDAERRHVFAHGSYDDCFLPKLDTGEVRGGRKVAIISPQSGDHLSLNYVTLDKG
jgi:hypothetical protein